jgi:predicted HD phosphohydrolase
VCMTAARSLVVMARGLRRCSRNVSTSWRARRSGCGGASRVCTATLLHFIGQFILESTTNQYVIKNNKFVSE